LSSILDSSWILFVVATKPKTEKASAECYGQADHVKKKNYYSIVTENINYSLRVAKPLEDGRSKGVSL
jgi:hypothetical protein